MTKINEYGLTDRGNELKKTLRLLIEAVARLEEQLGLELEVEVRDALKNASQAYLRASDPIPKYIQKRHNKNVPDKVMELLNPMSWANIDRLAHTILVEKGLYGDADVKKAWTEAVLIELNKCGYLFVEERD